MSYQRHRRNERERQVSEVYDKGYYDALIKALDLVLPASPEMARRIIAGVTPEEVQIRAERSGRGDIARLCSEVINNE